MGGKSLICHSFISGNIIDGKRRADVLIDDMFIRRFLTGTWHNLFVSEVSNKKV